MDKVVYFFDQPFPRRGLGRRKRKLADDIYDGLKLNSSYFQYNDHGSYQSSEFGSSRSLLPEIKQAVSLLKQQLDGLFGDQEYNQRLYFEEALLTAPELLTRLELYMNMFTEVKPTLPISLEHDLMSSWQELITNVVYTVREWQCLSMREEAEMPVDKLAPKDVLSLSDLPTEQSSKTFSKTQSIAGDLDKQNVIGKDLPSVRTQRKSISSHLSGIMEDKERADGKKGVTSKRKSYQLLSVGSSRSESVLSNQKVATHPVLKNPGTISESKLASNQVGYWTQIQFQLSSKACKDKGWIVNSNDTEAEITIEKTLRQVTERLRMAIRERDHGERGKEPDYSVNLFHFYGENIRESVSKSKWSGSLTAQGLQMLRGLKPRIPPLTMAIGNGKMLFRVSMMDGSSIVYYPSGQVAVTCTRPGQSQHPGYYTVAYDEDPGHRMLACFTPSGKGCCYHDDGSMWFLATESGITLAEKGSQVYERIGWPATGAKLSTSLFLQLNPKLTFRCNNRQSMQLSFSWQRQSVKFYVGLTPGAERSPTKEDLGCLLSGLEFESKTAHNFSPSYYQRFIKQKNKVKLTGRKRTSSTCEAVTEAALLSSSSETAVGDKESGTSRLKLEKRIKVLLDDWLLHYRVSLGIIAPEMSTPNDDQCLLEHNIQSTRSSPIGRGVMTEGEEGGSAPPSGLPAIRLLSAPVGESVWSIGQRRLGGQLSRSVQFQERPPGKTDLPRESYSVNFASSTALESSAPRPVSGVGPRSVVIRPVSPEVLGAMLGLCPSKVCLAMLGELGAEKPCCVHRTIPFITDVEYDDFIKKFIPANQMAVVSIISSLSPELTSDCRSMLERIHEQQFRTRLWPCFQSRNDPFRIFLYDVATAANQLGDTEPLLTRQHNVVPGMFLIYKNGRLQFCDHIFNGYSTTEKDFLKQLETTNALADRGHFLPNNFRFCPQARTSYSQFAPGKGMGMDVRLKKKQAIRLISLENGIGLNSRSYQSRAALDQVINIISISNSSAAAGIQIMSKKARSDKSDSLSSSALASHST